MITGNQNKEKDEPVYKGTGAAKLDVEGIEDNSYDSEFEADFFGGKNPELNAEMDKNFEK